MDYLDTQLTTEARFNLIYGYPKNPMTLNVCRIEVMHNTELGKKILKDLGYKINSKTSHNNDFKKEEIEDE